MPEEDYVWLPRQSILSFEEIERLTGVFSGLGVTKVRITGGEPLLRHELPALVRALSRNPRISDLALTTNGLLLQRLAEPLRTAGLMRLTVSLDTLKPARYEAFTRSKRHGDVLAGLEAARAAGFAGTKLNAVVLRGVNDDEILDLLDFGRIHDIEVRFIEYMDVGGATRWSMDQVVTREEILEVIRARFGAADAVSAADPPGARAPAERFRLTDGTTFGIIASTTAPFCGDCDRSRLTADGLWLLCLYSETGTDLKSLLREGASDEELARRIADAWRERRDRGAEDRLAAPGRGILYQLDRLRSDPHREMHTRGG